MDASPESLTRLWFTSGRSELWNCNSTYCPVPYDLLPDLNDVSNDFSWLNDFPDGDSSCTLDSQDKQIAHFDSIVRESKELQLDLPSEFIQFMSDSGLHGKVPTCTGCRLELSDSLIAFPWNDPVYALRFMNDSQNCIMWYLLLRPRTSARVIVSPYFFDREIFDLLRDEDEGPEYQDIFANANICADSFLEFIYRFWIENVIWYSLRDEKPLSPRASEYRRRITNKP